MQTLGPSADRYKLRSSASEDIFPRLTELKPQLDYPRPSLLGRGTGERPNTPFGFSSPRMVFSGLMLVLGPFGASVAAVGAAAPPR